MNRDFRLFWCGQAASSFGSVFTLIAIPLVAVRFLDATPTQVGILVAAGMAPMLVLGLAVASWVDQLRRKRPTLILTDLAAAAVLLALAVLLATGTMSVTVLMGFVFVLGTLTVIVETAYFAHLRSVAPDDDVVRARAWLEAGEHIGGAAGRAAAGPVTALFGAAAPFLVNLASHLVSAATLLGIRRRETPAEADTSTASHGASGHRLLAGFAEIRREPFLRSLLPFLLAQQLVAGAVAALLAPFLLTVLAVPTAAYGVLFVLLGFAGTVGALIGARMAGRKVEPRLMVLLGFGLAAVSTAILPAAAGPLPLAATIAATGIALPVLFGTIANAGITGFITLQIPEQRLGRVAASMQVALGLAMLLGALAGGLLGDHIGIRFGLLLAAACSVLSLLTIRRPLRLARHTARGQARDAEKLAEVAS